MHRQKNRSYGFTLIEVIFFIVIMGISLAGITPMFMTILDNLHVMSDGMQAEYLGLETLEAMKAANGQGVGFPTVTEVNFPSQTGIDIGGTIMFDRVVEIEGMIPGKTPDPCTGVEYSGEVNKCLTVTVKANGTGEVLFRERIVISQL